MFDLFSRRRCSPIRSEAAAASRHRPKPRFQNHLTSWFRILISVKIRFDVFPFHARSHRIAKWRRRQEQHSNLGKTIVSSKAAYLPRKVCIVMLTHSHISWNKKIRRNIQIVERKIQFSRSWPNRLFGIGKIKFQWNCSNKKCCF